MGLLFVLPQFNISISDIYTFRSMLVFFSFQKSRVKISNVVIKNIRGTASTSSVVQILCSSKSSCKNVKVSNIDLVLTRGTKGPATSICSNVKPITSGKQIPTICKINRQLSQEELVYYLH